MEKVFKLMHYESYRRTWIKNAFFKFPTVIFTAIAGSINLSLEKFNEEYRFYITCFIGGLSLLNGIIISICTFMEYTQDLEGHKIAYMSWNKFSRKIQIELSKIEINDVNMKKFVI